MSRSFNLLVLAIILHFSCSFTPLLMNIGSHSLHRDGAANTWNMAHSDEQELYEAEELAAYDAHDVPDAGVEAAAMERAVILADEMKMSHVFKGKSSAKAKINTNSMHPTSNFSNDEILDAEEAAVYDPYNLSDAAMESAAMERAAMMAYRMMANRRQNLKTQLSNIKSAEDEMLLLEKASDDLTKSYREHPSQFKSTFSESDANYLAIQMIERAIANAAVKTFEAEASYEAEKKELSMAADKRNMAEALAERFKAEMKSSDDYSLMTEEFGDEKDVEERRRDKATSHALQHLIDDTINLAEAANERREITHLDRMRNKITRLEESQQSLKADLHELVKLINERLEKEWGTESETYVA